MNNTNFENEILSLISEKIEGPYWDFKRSWHTKDVDLLHDIICMANNLVSHDGYIIIGIDENNDFSPYSCKDDERKKNNNELVTFLRSKPFWGGLRPIVLVKTFYINSDEIDVLIIKNSMKTPFVLSENYPKDKNGKQLFAHHVYIRINDSNTPKNASADIDKVEYLWRKRLGIDMSVLAKLQIYLSKASDWIYNDELSFFYYKFDPLYIIKLNSLDYKRSEFYNKLYLKSEAFSWNDYQILYNNTVLYNGIMCFNNGGHELRSVPQSSLISIGENSLSYYYFIINSKEYYVDQIFKKQNKSKQDDPVYNSFLIHFDNEAEVTTFNSYLDNFMMEFIDEKQLPDSTYDQDFCLDQRENEKYIFAKQAKWIFDNKFSIHFK
ncbi:helix-turn-helix domain-containing protein [Leuconostoc gasicomitatum]|jgi:hypothetical protein|uniref:AlbA family DNA-binding domain-containing protein n=1 Tax=Leuconostoc gasicomitatum TaxID=115778 RepID=UPI000744CB19|nr:ATP-binding protein [Leuconostoc gasicomitatum]MBZ5972419.1 ATP-binding protein [Leuconostoc gasicomitatum]CUR64577.1 Putative ATP-binding protein [Leuconostoc gasicomitatum KG16-1]